MFRRAWMGLIIDVQVFTRDSVKKDERALQLEQAEIDRFKKDLDDRLRIVENDIYDRVDTIARRADGRIRAYRYKVLEAK